MEHNIVAMSKKVKRGRFEEWSHKHRDSMALLRTIAGIIAVILGVLTFLRVYGII